MQMREAGTFPRIAETSETLQKYAILVMFQLFAGIPVSDGFLKHHNNMWFWWCSNLLPEFRYNITVTRLGATQNHVLDYFWKKLRNAISPRIFRFRKSSRYQKSCNYVLQLCMQCMFWQKKIMCWTIFEKVRNRHNFVNLSICEVVVIALVLELSDATFECIISIFISLCSHMDLNLVPTCVYDSRTVF